MVYLIHFDKRYKHALHYLGFVERDLEQRLERHRKGIGSKLLKAVNEAGIGWSVVKTWPDGTRDFERKLKNRGSHCRICQICKTSHD